MIYMLEEFNLKPGVLKEYVDLFHREYVPRVKARGVELVGSWITPPIEMIGEGNTVMALWSMRDQAHFWQERAAANQDQPTKDWWAKAQAYHVSRRRKFLDPTKGAPLH